MCLCVCLMWCGVCNERNITGTGAGARARVCVCACVRVCVYVCLRAR